MLSARGAKKKGTTRPPYTMPSDDEDEDTTLPCPRRGRRRAVIVGGPPRVIAVGRRCGAVDGSPLRHYVGDVIFRPKERDNHTRPRTNVPTNRVVYARFRAHSGRKKSGREIPSDG